MTRLKQKTDGNTPSVLYTNLLNVNARGIEMDVSVSIIN
jgi:hypothetical protein